MDADLDLRVRCRPEDPGTRQNHSIGALGSPPPCSDGRGGMEKLDAERHHRGRFGARQRIEVNLRVGIPVGGGNSMPKFANQRERDFHEAMLGIYLAAKLLKPPYYATRFHEM